MVNNKSPMNHHQQQLQTNGVTLKMIRMKNGNSAGANGVAGAVPVAGQKQEDEILEVNLIGVNENGEPDNVLGDFTEFLDSGQFSDMVMRCSDGRFIECHRLVLAARARNLRHFVCGRNFSITELVFRSCVKFEHLQALVSLIYRGHINGQDHQITSTLWKLFKIFGIRVTAKCFKALKNGQKELAHQLKHDSVENDVAKGAMKFEKIVQEFRSETRRKTRRTKSSVGGGGGGAVATTEGGQNGDATKKKAGRQPGVIVISDDEWSSASSSVSSLSSSSSEGELVDNTAQSHPRGITAKQQANGKSSTTQKGGVISTKKTSRAEKIVITDTQSPQLKIQEVKSSQQLASTENWESSGSSEGEYVESYKPPAAKKQRLTATDRNPMLTAPSCLEYNQNEMSIVVKSHAALSSQEAINKQIANNTTPTKQDVNPFGTESEAIICSPQIMFNIKSEPIDEDDEDGEEEEEEGEDLDMGVMDEVDMEHLGIKMEIVDDEDYEQHMLAQDRHGRRLPPPLLIPIKPKPQKQIEFYDDDPSNEYLRGGKLEELIRDCLPGSSPPANFPPFILRNPRGNQTRTYTTENLWSALMDVKAGESIYRASQQHKVPRKTLRNWMKRCQIKSSYPMPSQLKEAAEKKKQLQIHKITY